MVELGLVPTVIRDRGTWYPYPTDEAQAEQNLYCNHIPDLVAERDARIAQELASQRFLDALKMIGLGAVGGAALTAILLLTLQ
jgi:hypothetical protein